MTPVNGKFLDSAGLARSNLAYHSSRIPSLMPFSLSPVSVNFSMMLSYTGASISFSTCSALDANWMGPPKRLNWSVRSSTWTCIFGSLTRLLARARPPTPAPAIMTRKGFSSVISSVVSANVPTSSAVPVSTAVDMANAAVLARIANSLAAAAIKLEGTFNSCFGRLELLTENWRLSPLAPTAFHPAAGLRTRRHLASASNGFCVPADGA
mmetsp:Transcript_67500/g.117447  ORF Transcript_67500/g.117447 Transcript_67500/m.117447 type:complete len:210 (+) Transcript_67500:97-726(+)